MSSFFDNGRSRFSRRTVLRGAGVALALPWLESLAGPARAQAVAMPKRFVAIFLPCGAPEFWKPPTTGIGDAWQLSSVLDLLGPLKSKVNVMSGLETGSVFNADGGSEVEPVERHVARRVADLFQSDRAPQTAERDGGQWHLCRSDLGRKSDICRKNRAAVDADRAHQHQWLLRRPALLEQPQRVLADAHQAALQARRSVGGVQPTSWVCGRGRAMQRRLHRGATSASACSTPFKKKRCGRTWAVERERQAAVNEFLTSVRSVEKRVTDGATGGCSVAPTMPVFPTVDNHFRENTGGYSKSVHFDLMNELLSLALQCDRTRIASYMLEDERSEFVCDHIAMRTFSPLISVPGTGVCGEWHGGGQQGSQDMFGSIVRWNVGKVGELCQKLDSVIEANGQSVLDNSVIFLGAAIHGSAESAASLPSLTIGSGGGALKTNQHLDLGPRPLRDFYFTLMNGVYDLGVADFGTNATGAPVSMIQPLLA